MQQQRGAGAFLFGGANPTNSAGARDEILRPESSCTCFMKISQVSSSATSSSMRTWRMAANEPAVSPDSVLEISTTSPIAFAKDGPKPLTKARI